jgi:enterochelin esterase-like enzyme/lysophospholipase L1-like esterase
MNNLRLASAFFFLIFTGSIVVFAQKETPKPSPEQIDAWKKAEEERLHNDWANFARFSNDNEKTGLPAAGEKRVVFMGNSITEGWINQDPGFFAGKPFVNRGISGQTTPQMVVRLRPDVINLRPAVVVILAGINDIAGNTGPSTLEMIEDNLASMAEQAKANNIRVVLSSVLPAFDFPWRQGMQPAEKVVQLNTWIKSYAKDNDCVYLDYFTPMADERHGLKSEYTYDGVHPNLAGYKVMEPLVESAIQKALGIQKPSPADSPFMRQPTPNDKLISAEVIPGNKVKFRIYAPQARSVSVAGDMGWNLKIDFVKDSVGIWTGIFNDAKPGVYRYSFIVDGVRVNDPKSSIVTESPALLEVTGGGADFWAMKEVPHGDLRKVWYPSSSLKTTRRMHIYTHPGYDRSKDKLPVLYLIHGGGDNDAAWPTVGKANFILDNLLAEGRIKPMIVVMPNGSIPDEDFTRDLMNDVIPYVEKNYRVKTGKDNRALMGLSMGGLETLNTGIPNSSSFAYLLVLSSGWIPNQAAAMEQKENMVKQYADDVNKNVKLFLLTQGGQEDIAWKNCQNMMKIFDKYGLKYKYSEKPGGHTWFTWRDNLFEFAPVLFR